MSQEIEIRPAQLSDIDAMVAITEEVFGPVSIDRKIEQMLGCHGASWIEIKGQIVAREVRENLAGCFVAVKDGDIVGYITTAINTLACRGIIPNLAVTAKAQGHGLGRKLILRALEHFRSIGLKQAKIETLACNEVGQHLYPSLGFKEVERQIHYIMPL